MLEKGESTIVEIPQWLVENNKLLDSSTEDTTVKPTDVDLTEKSILILIQKKLTIFPGK